MKVNYTVEGSGALINGGLCTVIWESNYEIAEVSDGFIIKYYTSGLNIDGYNSLIRLSKPGYEDALVSITAVINEQEISMSVQVNGDEIAQNNLVELYFKESVNITARIFADREGTYLTGGNLKILSDNYQNDFIETLPTYFGLIIIINGDNFSSGLNTIYLRFELANYTTTSFSFQFYIRAQSFSLEVKIDNYSIPENYLLERSYKEELFISCRAFVEAEAIYLSGGSVTFSIDTYEFDMSEYPNYWYNRTFSVSANFFSLGINYAYVKFELANYTTTTFSFQFYIRAQSISLEVKIDDQYIPENYLLESYYNALISISCRAFAEAEEIYLAGGSITFIIDTYEFDMSEYPNYWYNRTFSVSANFFSLGINYVYVKFDLSNYTTTTFSFQVLVNQKEINVHTIDFTDSIKVYSGESLSIWINLTEAGSNIAIENAIVYCYWEFGTYYFENTEYGLYKLDLDMSTNILGTYRFNMIITPEESSYKTTEFSFLIIISEKPLPDYVFWIVFIGLILVIGILGSFSLRS
ncbi:MAG: hypothetical protein MUP85_24430, partial [Candidatus Lokiarchaeota archaeon]|nr:hypothetical protein [Candidatus Lokiarchaeota archaeon]